jgi:hypothetical protein
MRQDKIGCGRIEGNAVVVVQGDLLGNREAAGMTLPLEAVRLLAPVLPGKIIGIGRNYAAHAREMGNVPPEEEPLIFLKAPSTVISPGDAIVLPAASQRVDHEAELGVVIGKAVYHVPEHEDPLTYVLGYVCVNDVTARDLQKKDVQFTRGKSFDTFMRQQGGAAAQTGIDTSRLSRAHLRVWRSILDIVMAKDKAGRFLHPTLYGLYHQADSSGHVIRIDLSDEESLTQNGEFKIETLDPKGASHVTTIRLYLATIERAYVGESARYSNGLIPFAGLRTKQRYTEVLGHELAHAATVFQCVE